MAMVGDALGAAIQAKIQAIPGISITKPDELTAFCNALGEAIVTYIQANAVVETEDTVVIPVTSATGLPSNGTGTGVGFIL
jgi:hypothetical protein